MYEPRNLFQIHISLKMASRCSDGPTRAPSQLSAFSPMQNLKQTYQCWSGLTCTLSLFSGCDLDRFLSRPFFSAGHQCCVLFSAGCQCLFLFRNSLMSLSTSALLSCRLSIVMLQVRVTKARAQPWTACCGWPTACSTARQATCRR